LRRIPICGGRAILIGEVHCATNALIMANY